MKTILAPLSIRRNPLEAALKRARTVAPDPPDQSFDDIAKMLRKFDRRIEGLSNRIAETAAVRESLFGVEKQERKRLSAQIAELESRLSNCLEDRIVLRFEYFDAVDRRGELGPEAEPERWRIERYCDDHQKLDLTPLLWRNKDGWPLFAVFSLEEETFSLGTRITRETFFPSDRIRFTERRFCRPALPPQIEACFKDVHIKLSNLAWQHKKTRLISAKFSGVIPLQAKKKIRQAKGKFKQTYALAEVKDWNVEERKPATIDRDPLAVGWDGKDLWVITPFDTTTLERYVAQFHTERRKGRLPN